MTDKILTQIQAGLESCLPWLCTAYGRAQRITKKIGGKTYIFPAVFRNSEDYTDVSPDSGLGNYSFFVIHDPQEIQWEPNLLGEIKVPFSVIFWLDLRHAAPHDFENRNTEAVKAGILKALSVDIKVRDGSFRFNRIYERAENIFRDFPGVMETDNQFLMHPYAGFRFEGVLKVQQNCI